MICYSQHLPLPLRLGFCSSYSSCSSSPVFVPSCHSAFPNHPAPIQAPCFLRSSLSSVTCVMISVPPMRQWGTINVAVSIILRNNSSLGAQAQPSRSDWGTGGTLPLSDGPNCDTLLTRPCHQLQPQAPGRSLELFLPRVT